MEAVYLKYGQLCQQWTAVDCKKKRKKKNTKNGKEGNMVAIAGLLTFLVISIYLERVEQ